MIWEILIRIDLALKVLRKPQDEVLVLWKNDEPEPCWKAWYDGFESQDQEGIEAAKSAATASKREKLMQRFRDE